MTYDKSNKDFDCIYLLALAEEVPLSLERVREYVNFICGYVVKQNKLIKHCRENGKDTEYLIYDRDRAMYVLGLGEKPVPPWHKHDKQKET